MIYCEKSSAQWPSKFLIAHLLYKCLVLHIRLFGKACRGIGSSPLKKPFFFFLIYGPSSSPRDQKSLQNAPNFTFLQRPYHADS